MTPEPSNALDLRTAGVTGLLATFDTLAEVVAHRAALDAARPEGVVEVVSGARTLLLRFDPRQTDATRLRADLHRVDRLLRTATDRAAPDTANSSHTAERPDAAGPSVVEIPVVYDGEDLRAVADHARMTTAQFRAWHTGQDWTSAFCGFAPGFSYLTGTTPSLEVPRRSTSRTAVPSGAVALAGEFSAVYPRESPGGWQLVGRTDAVMWSLDRDPPALAPAGVRIRFVDVT